MYQKPALTMCVRYASDSRYLCRVDDSRRNCRVYDTATAVMIKGQRQDFQIGRAWLIFRFIVPKYY